MFIPVWQLIKRRWVFEATVSAFAALTSFMYHLTQALQTTIVMEELQWHFLDNIGAVAGFAVFFTYLAALKDPFTDAWLKFIFVLFAVIVQVPHPWDLQYTLGPITLFSLVPVVSLIYKFLFSTPQQASLLVRLHHVFVANFVPREVVVGGGTLMTALFFFYLGLDEKNDPYRMYHGMWHVLGGLASLRMWRIVKDPIVQEIVDGMDRIAVLKETSGGIVVGAGVKEEKLLLSSGVTAINIVKEI